MSDVDKVISVCSAKDLPVWAVSASRITKFIDAEKYMVIVPERDLSEFKRFTPQTIEVICEDNYTDSIQQILKSKFNEGNKCRYGWYLQQFIKLSALSEAEPNETYLIWDADTIPLNPLNFTNGDRLKYYKASEHHPPYFNAIDRLLGLERVVNHSFISQCFPIRGKWIHEFVSFVESKHKIPWLEAIIQAIDFQEGSGFSEYETLGTFLSHKYRGNMLFVDDKWLRSGNSLIGGIQNLDNSIAKLMLGSFDYAAFEIWDSPSKSRLISRGLRHILYKAIGK
jgi:hypothetical protein